MNSTKCPHCGKWIGAMELHEDCARKQDGARDAETAAFVDGLIAKQRETDRASREHAAEIVAAQRLKTLDDAKQFARNWIETAMQHARNEDYWRTRCLEAEAKLCPST